MKKILLFIVFFALVPSVSLAGNANAELIKFMKNPLRWGTSPAVMPPGLNREISANGYDIYMGLSDRVGLLYKNNKHVGDVLVLRTAVFLNNSLEFFDNKEELTLPEGICAGCTAKILDGTAVNEPAAVFVQTHRQDDYLGLSMHIDLKATGREAMFEIIKLVNDYLTTD